jgi:putative sterol carrier protein
MGTVTHSGRPLYASLADLTEGGNADLAATFQNLASRLESADFDVAIEYQIGDGKNYRTFFVHAANGRSAVRAEAAPEAALRIFMAEETWREIASGAISPADAFCDGRVRVIGDTDLGVAMLKHLAGTSGRIGIC